MQYQEHSSLQTAVNTAATRML